MTREQYLAALKKLDMRPSAIITGKTLGLSLRQLTRLATGGAPVSPMLERLLEALLEIKRLEALAFPSSGYTTSPVIARQGQGATATVKITPGRVGTIREILGDDDENQ